MNAILPDDLSYYERVDGAPGDRVLAAENSGDDGQSSAWDGSAGLEMEAGPDMPWVAPEPLR